MLITVKSLESSKEVPQDQSKLYGYVSLVAITKVKRYALSFSRFAPHHDQFLRPLDLICVSVTTVRRHDVALPSIFATVFMTPRPHELTLLSSVSSTPDTRMVKRPLRPRSGYKREPLPRTANAKAPFPFELGIATALVLPPASLGHFATRASPPSIRPS
jgi:hypothetical protein